tara:strand:+ start:465 stop:707 length:243 start_codon:yes stop_codon:yes gene_type:complete
MTHKKPHRATEKATDKQIGGKHYQSYSIQPIEFIVANKLSFIQGCIIKYICRFENKNGIEDLEKIKHYCDLQIQLLKNKK